LLLYILSLIGVAVFAASGALAAARKGLDLIGITSIAIVTAIGGGTLRDILLDRHPVFWIADSVYLSACLLGCLGSLFYVQFRNPPDSALLIADALGLALFTISGTQIAEQRDLPGLICVVMGLLTGVAGGVIRDALVADVPVLFRREETLYATASIIGSVVYLSAQNFGVERTSAALAGMILVAALRFAGIRWQLRLPVFEVPGRNLKSDD
jgi:uncharacterized membrane protein YeiH